MNRGQRCDSIAAQINTEHLSSHQLFVDRAIAAVDVLSVTVDNNIDDAQWIMDGIGVIIAVRRRIGGRSVGGQRSKGKREESQSQSQSQCRPKLAQRKKRQHDEMTQSPEPGSLFCVLRLSKRTRKPLWIIIIEESSSLIGGSWFACDCGL